MQLCHGHRQLDLKNHGPELKNLKVELEIESCQCINTPFNFNPKCHLYSAHHTHANYDVLGKV